MKMIVKGFGYPDLSFIIAAIGILFSSTTSSNIFFPRYFEDERIYHRGEKIIDFGNEIAFFLF